MRAGPQLGVAKAARAPPCTLPILGRRFYSLDEIICVTIVFFVTLFSLGNVN